IPTKRTGLPLGDMDDNQRAAAMKLLDAALSDKGKLKATEIMTLESVLREMENNPGRVPTNYFVSIFGTPGDAKAWGWKFEGHHLALNYTIIGGKDIAVTPSFMGSNPAEVRAGDHKGLRVLAAEEDLARALLLTLVEAGKKEVVFSEKAPGEILTAENRVATVLDPVGIPASDMTEEQKKGLRQLISEYTGRNRKDLSDADLAQIDKAGFDKIRFGWAGGLKPGEAYYYRIQGPTFLMESANVQNEANHIHATWRSFDNDFGRDFLGMHFQRHEAEKAGQ
ncbi:MAG: hypothetical protein JWO82_1412, partial [Akkermansiaceae bacterium]|nr:hypothetical protein [Akkermansiaceae bacterium]